MADDKIIQFPTDRIVKKRKNELDAQRKKMGENGKEMLYQNYDNQKQDHTLIQIFK